LTRLRSRPGARPADDLADVAPVLEVGVHAGDPFGGLEAGVDRADTDCRVLYDLAVGGGGSSRCL
jgi:hypothetical protein